MGGGLGGDVHDISLRMVGVYRSRRMQVVAAPNHHARGPPLRSDRLDGIVPKVRCMRRDSHVSWISIGCGKARDELRWFRDLACSNPDFRNKCYTKR
jgi:hypothetical protein